LSRDFYVYIYRNPLKGNEPFYVGKGKNDRMLHHLKSKKKDNLHKYYTIQKIRKETRNDPLIEIYVDNLLEEDALSVEKNLIKFYGRRDNKTGVLTNMTDGGEGVNGWSDELKTYCKRYIQCKDQEGNPIRITNTDPRWLSGELIGITKNVPRSKQAKEKSASKLRGRIQSSEERLKHSVALIGKPKSEIHKQNLSKVRKGLIFVKDKTGKCFKLPPDSPLLLTGELVGVSKGNSWYHDPLTLQQKCCKVQPDGWIKGRFPR